MVFTNYTAEIIIALGIVLLTVEVIVLSFSTFWLFFLGLSMVISGAAMYFGVIPESWVSIIFSNAILTAILAGMLWKPLKRFQQSADNGQAKSDFHGHRFVIDKDIDKNHFAETKYSGIAWKVKSDSFIPAGSEVEVVAVEVGIFWVEKT